MLSQILRLEAENKLPAPATSLEACIVGPNSEERNEGKPRWGFCGRRKRKRSTTEQDSHGKDKHDDNETDRSTDCDLSSTFSHAIKVFLSSGCCVIPGVLPTDIIEKIKVKATSDLEYLNAELQNRRKEAIESNQEHLLARVARGDFQELVDRDGGRRDVRFELDRFPFTSPGLVYNPIVYSLVRELLGGGDINLLYAGIMWALPQSKPKEASSIESCSQKWHADGGHLFDHTHLPPHCINVFYPLVDIKSNTENGGTEIMAGTHRLGKLNDSSAGKFTLCCDAGGAIMFDYRLKHRGGASFTEPRPVLYLAYSKPFFRDAGNTRSGHSLITSPKRKPSPPWVSRILSGEITSFGELDWGTELDGDEHDNKNGAYCTNRTEAVNSLATNMSVGSGERCILFKMNVEIPGFDVPKILTVHHGDVALEVSSRFCKENELQEDFIPILAETIQTQVDTCLKEG